MNDVTTIVWTPEMRDHFATAHKRAAAENKDSFVFDGHIFVVAYAKYLLEYLNQRMPPSVTLAEAGKPRRGYARSRGGR